QVRAHPAAEPGPAATARRGGHRRAAAHHRRLGQPLAGHRPRRAGRRALDRSVGRARLTLMRVTEAVAATLAGLGADTVFGVVGSGNFHITNALISQGARYVAARHE